MKKRNLSLWAVLFWLLVWQAGSMALHSDILLVSPLRVLQTLLALIQTTRFWSSLLGSMGRILGGFLLAAALGTLLAALAARFKRVEELLAPLVLAMKTVPVASFIILALIWFGSRNLSVFIALVMVFPVMYTNVLSGIRARDDSLLEMARVFKIPALRRIRCIDLPQVMPYFRAGCTLGLGLCWKAGVAAEVIGMPVPSIGERLQQAKVYLDTPELFAWTLVIVLMSVGFEKLFMAALGALDGAADGRFAHAKLPGKLRHGLFIYIVAKDGSSLLFRQLVFNHAVHAGNLLLAREPRALIVLISDSFHCGNIPFHNSAR